MPQNLSFQKQSNTIMEEFDEWRIQMQIHLSSLHEGMRTVIKEGLKSMKIDADAIDYTCATVFTKSIPRMIAKNWMTCII